MYSNLTKLNHNNAVHTAPHLFLKGGITWSTIILNFTWTRLINWASLNSQSCSNTIRNVKINLRSLSKAHNKREKHNLRIFYENSSFAVQTNCAHEIFFILFIFFGELSKKTGKLAFPLNNAINSGKNPLYAQNQLLKHLKSVNFNIINRRISPLHAKILHE